MRVLLYLIIVTLYSMRVLLQAMYLIIVTLYSMRVLLQAMYLSNSNTILYESTTAGNLRE